MRTHARHSAAKLQRIQDNNSYAKDLVQKSAKVECISPIRMHNTPFIADDTESNLWQRISCSLYMDFSHRSVDCSHFLKFCHYGNGRRVLPEALGLVAQKISKYASDRTFKSKINSIGELTEKSFISFITNQRTSLNKRHCLAFLGILKHKRYSKNKDHLCALVSPILSSAALLELRQDKKDGTFAENENSSRASWKDVLRMHADFLKESAMDSAMHTRIDNATSFTKKSIREIFQQGLKPERSASTSLDSKKLCELLGLNSDVVFLLEPLGFLSSAKGPQTADSLCESKIRWSVNVFHAVVQALINTFESGDSITKTSNFCLSFLDHLFTLHFAQGTLTPLLAELIAKAQENEGPMTNIKMAAYRWINRLTDPSSDLMQAQLYFALPCTNQLSTLRFDSVFLDAQKDSNFISTLCRTLFSYNSDSKALIALSDILLKSCADIRKHELFPVLVLCGSNSTYLKITSDVLGHCASIAVERRWASLGVHIVKHFPRALDSATLRKFFLLARTKGTYTLSFVKALSDECPSLSISEYTTLLRTLLSSESIPIRDVYAGIAKVRSLMDKRWMVMTPSAFLSIFSKIDETRFSTTRWEDKSIYREITFALASMYLKIKRIYENVDWPYCFFLMAKNYPDGAMKKTLLAGLWSDFYSSSRRNHESKIWRTFAIFDDMELPKGYRYTPKDMPSSKTLTSLATRHIYWKTYDSSFAFFACSAYGIPIASLIPFCSADQRAWQRKCASEIVHKHTHVQSSCDSFISDFRATQLKEVHFRRVHFYKLILAASKLSTALKSVAAILSAGYMLLPKEVEHILKLPSKMNWSKSLSLLQTLRQREQCEVGRSDALAHHLLPANHRLWTGYENAICVKNTNFDAVSMKHRRALKRREVEESINGFMFISPMLWSEACSQFNRLMASSESICGANALNQLVIACIEQGGDVSQVFQMCELYAQHRKMFLYPVTLEYMLRNATSLTHPTASAIDTYIKAHHFKNFLFEPQIPLQIKSWVQYIASNRSALSQFSNEDKELSPILRDHALSIAQRVSFGSGMALVDALKNNTDGLNHLIGALSTVHNQPAEVKLLYSRADSIHLDFVGTLLTKKADISATLTYALASSRWKKALSMLESYFSCKLFQIDSEAFVGTDEDVHQVTLVIRHLWTLARNALSERIGSKFHRNQDIDPAGRLSYAFNIDRLLQHSADRAHRFMSLLVSQSTHPRSAFGFVQLVACEKRYFLSKDFFNFLAKACAQSAVEIAETNAALSASHRKNVFLVLYSSSFFVDALAVADKFQRSDLEEAGDLYSRVRRACAMALPARGKAAWNTYWKSQSAAIFASYMCIEASHEKSLEKCQKLLIAALRNSVPTASFHHCIAILNQRMKSSKDWKAASSFLSTKILETEGYDMGEFKHTLEAIVNQHRNKGMSRESDRLTIPRQAPDNTLECAGSICKDLTLHGRSNIFTQCVPRSRDFLPIIDVVTLHGLMQQLCTDIRGSMIIGSHVEGIIHRLQSLIDGIDVRIGTALSHRGERGTRTHFPPRLRNALEILSVTSNAGQTPLGANFFRKFGTHVSKPDVLIRKDARGFASEWQMYLDYFLHLDARFHAPSLIDHTLNTLYKSCKSKLIPQFIKGLHPTKPIYLPSATCELLRFSCELFKKYDTVKSTKLYKECLTSLSIEAYLPAPSTPIYVWKDQCVSTDDMSSSALEVDVFERQIRGDMPDANVELLVKEAQEGHQAHNFSFLLALFERCSQRNQLKALALQALKTSLEVRQPYEKGILKKSYTLMNCL